MYIKIFSDPSRRITELEVVEYLVTEECYVVKNISINLLQTKLRLLYWKTQSVPLR